jgi:hypothetical protein
MAFMAGFRHKGGLCEIAAKSCFSQRARVRPRAGELIGRERRAYDRSVILRCTKKLLAIIGPSLVVEPGPTPDAEDWYANLLWFDGRKCLLLTHSATLFSIFQADVRAADLRATGPLVSRLIGRELRSEGLPAGTFADLEPDKVILAKTASRSVLGCMNDMALQCEHAINGSGGLSRTDLAALNHWLRRNINSARGYQSPIELTAVRLVAHR